MFRLAIRFFICSLLLAAAGCKTYESTLQEQHAAPCEIEPFVPKMGKVLYKAEVEITGHHLSGLLLFKTMEDYTQRIAFLLETGQSIFDFGFGQDGTFKVYYVQKKFNRKPVITALRKDFELLLLQQHELFGQEHSYQFEGNRYNPYRRGDEKIWLVTDQGCTKLIKVLRSSKRKEMVELFRYPSDAATPDSVWINHKTFNFTIALKKLEQ